MRKALAFTATLLLFSMALAQYEGSIHIYLDQEVIRQGGLMQFTVGLNKIAGPASDVSMEYWVESSEGEKWGYGSTSVYMNAAPSYSNVSKDVYIFSSQPPGTYFLKAVVDMGSFFPTLSQSQQFLVLSREISSVGSVLKIVDYPQEINAESGWSKLYTVKIRNEGDEILPNISFVISGIPSTWYIMSPEAYYKVQPGAELVYSLRIDVPSNATTLDYNMTYRVYSTTSAYDEKTSVLRVFSSTYALLTSELQKVESDRETLASAIQDRQLMGYNITTAWILLGHIDTQINFAKEYMANGNYDNALVSLASAESLVEQGMVSVETADMLPITTGLDWRFFVLLLVLFPISFLIYNYWSQKKLARILGYYSSEVMENLKQSMPGAKLKLSKKIGTEVLEDVKEKMGRQSDEGLRKKLDRTKKLLRLIEMQYSTGAISKESYAEIKKGLQTKIDLLEKKVGER
jgi:hypothetical protein